MGKKRRPPVGNVPTPERIPKAAPQVSTGGQHPFFCFRDVDRFGDPRWRFRLEGDEAIEVMDFVCEMARLSWNEIEKAQTGGGKRHKKHHSQEVSKVHADAQAALTKAELGEKYGGTLFRFRLSGVKRLWGFREGRVFHVVWWDPHHQVYETEPE